MILCVRQTRKVFVFVLLFWVFFGVVFVAKQQRHKKKQNKVSTHAFVIVYVPKFAMKTCYCVFKQKKDKKNNEIGYIWHATKSENLECHMESVKKKLMQTIQNIF